MKLKLVGDGLHGKGTRVWIDGEERKDVVSVVVTFDCRDANRAVVEYVVDDLEVEAEVTE